MTVRTDQADVRRAVICIVAIEVIHLERDFARAWVASTPATEGALLTPFFDKIAPYVIRNTPN
jgi:hypothetical protein